MIESSPVAKTAGVALCLWAWAAMAVAADPPPGYYDAVDGTTGSAIRAQLTTLTNQAIVRSYGDARTLLQDIDEDPANTDNILLVYTGVSTDSTWDAGVTWNREHSWPRSLGVGDSGADNSDLHMLWPCNPSVNSSRGNKPFGTAPGSWDPDQFGFPYRGRMARGMFYANTRYTYLNMAVIGSQPELVDWHFEQMPDQYDRRRNDRVYDWQQNRNPFVDRPEWVWAIFGDAPSDAQIVIAGAPAQQGGSTLTLDLGSVIRREGVAVASFDIDKLGQAPVTYTVSATGDVTTTVASPYAYGFPRGTRSLTVPVSFAGAFGPNAGTVVIDNTDVTSAGPGTGTDDGDDVVSLSATVLAPAAGSLDGALPVSQLTVDLGSVPVGSTSGTAAIPVYNIAEGAWAASLDIDGWSWQSGDSAAFAVELPTPASVPAGESVDVGVRLVAEAEGAFQAVATLHVSDEDLPGESQSGLAITLVGVVTPACLADVNRNGVIESGDFIAWVIAYNSGDSAADQNGDGLIDPSDFTAWTINYSAGCD